MFKKVMLTLCRPMRIYKPILDLKNCHGKLWVPRPDKLRATGLHLPFLACGYKAIHLCNMATNQAIVYEVYSPC